MKLLNDYEFADATSKMNAAVDHIDNYPRWNLGLFGLEEHKQILDLGCGPGWYFDAIMKLSPSLYVAADFSEYYLNEITRKAARVNNPIEIVQVDITNKEHLSKVYHHEYDYILCFDVIEHIEDDVNALCNIRTILCNTGRGRLIIRVPALPFIYGENDKAIGHFRRYYKQSFSNLLERCGFTIHKIGYQNFMGVFFWFATGKFFKRAAAANNSESKFINAAIPTLSAIEKVFPPPLGSSIYCQCSVL